MPSLRSGGIGLFPKLTRSWVDYYPAGKRPQSRAPRFLLRPVAVAGPAVVFRQFLKNIEPSVRVTITRTSIAIGSSCNGRRPAGPLPGGRPERATATPLRIWWRQLALVIRTSGRLRPRSAGLVAMLAVTFTATLGRVV